jgi:glutathione synthase/RimK-type ligase-like ATP-grasp enzyme
MSQPPTACARPIQTRIGVAALTRMAFEGRDLGTLWCTLMAKLSRDPTNAAAAMDMAAIAQLLGDSVSGLALQEGALRRERLYRSYSSPAEHPLRVLALAAPTDIGGNTPVEFLLEGSNVELFTLYVDAGAALPPIPEHDVAIVVAPGSHASRHTLWTIAALTESWPCAVLNRPARIAELERDRLHAHLRSVPGVSIPMTVRVGRDVLAGIGTGNVALRDRLADGEFPLIVRPLDSHAGRGLSRIEAPAGIAPYLADRTEDAFFLSHFVDYAGADGLFRKYRIVFVDGRAYACHLAIANMWNVWYLNADMADSADKRAEEARFMTSFDAEFGLRHGQALGEIASRVGLDYFAIDCAETKSGDLLLFEADNAMIVHDMDPAAVYPYKGPQTRRIFSAFVAMLHKYAGRTMVCAA